MGGSLNPFLQPATAATSSADKTMFRVMDFMRAQSPAVEMQPAVIRLHVSSRDV
jgi:hypothetical protein